MAKFSILFDGVVYSISIGSNMMGGTKYTIKKGKREPVAIYDSFEKEPDTLKLAYHFFMLAALIALDPEPMEDLGLREMDQFGFMKYLIDAGKETLNQDYKKRFEQWKMKK